MADHYDKIPGVLWHALDRQTDVTGISGTGRVAYALVLPSGVLMLWDTGWPTSGWYPDLVTVREIHGHDGETVITCLDEDEPGRDRAVTLLRQAIPNLTVFLTELSTWELPT